MSQQLLDNLGIDPSLLDNDDLKKLESFGKKIKVPIKNPNELLGLLRKEGIDIDKIIKKMRKNKEPKESKRIKRNEKCPCQSGKKYKKCCLMINESKQNHE